MSEAQSKFLPPQPKFVEFAPKQEPWAEYQLEDGTILRVRTVLVKVEDVGMFTPEGLPNYQARFQQVLDMTFTPEARAAAAELRLKKPGGSV